MGGRWKEEGGRKKEEFSAGGYCSFWNVVGAVVRHCKAVEDNRSPRRWRDC